MDGKTLIQEDVIQEEVNLYGIFLFETRFTIVLFKTENDIYHSRLIPIIDEEFKNANLPNEILIYKGGIVSICSTLCAKEELKKILNKIVKKANEDFDLRMTIIVGYEINKPEELNVCYKKCRELLNAGTLLDIDEIVFYDEKADNKKTKINKLIEASIEYIKNHYAEDIKLENVSKQIFITSGYLSILFKQTTGINFLDYLHRYRIQISKDLLKDVRHKVYEVAYMVGYQDEKYFSRTFKKFTGLSPRQYRESHKKDENG